MTDNDALPGVTVSTPALTVTEEDTTGATYTVVLDSQPTATVTVTVAGHAGTDVTPNPTSLTFTTTTWGTAQTVTVTAGADADMANESVSLTHSAASTDSDYEGITIAGVEVTVTDNDAANTPATGAPTITGTAQVGQTLTAVTTGIMDDDGLTSPTYTYQWIRVDADGTSNPVDITDATDATYTLVDAELGKTLKVRVRFTDDLETTETLTSAATATVMAVCAVPSLSGRNVVWTGAMTVAADPTFAGVFGFERERFGSLDDQTFTVGANDYTTQQVSLMGNVLTFATTNSALTAGEQAVLRLHVCAADLDFSAAPVPTGHHAYLFSTPGLSWSSGDTITLRLSLPAGDGGGGRPGQRHGLHGAVGRADLQHRRPAGHGHDGVDHATRRLTNGTEYTVRVSRPGPAPTTARRRWMCRRRRRRRGHLAQVMGVGVAPGNAQLVVTWTAVDTATGYTVQWMSSGQGYNTGDRQATVTTGSTTRYTIPSLINGTEYTVRVIATRTGANDGPPSAEVTGTPFTTPSAPQHLRGEPGDAQVTLTWDAPTSDGGSAILRYEVAVDDSGTWIDAGLDLEETVTGLTNGQRYAFAVRAMNAAGTGLASAVTASPVTTPGAPQHLSAVPGYAQVTLTWDAPTSDGGSAILRYEYAVDDSGTWIDAGLDLEETVLGLTNGQRYTFAVRAVNAAGAGPAATVTIVTSHPLPQAWLARFGRAATDHVVDAVSNRWQGGPQASHLTIGGVQTGALFGWIGRVGQAARLFAPSGGPGTGGGGTGPGMTVTDRNTGPVGLGGVDRKAGATLSGRAAQGALLGALGLPDPRALTDLRAALLGSSFFYSGAGDEDGQPRTPGRFGEWSAWGRGAASWFSGTDSGLSLDGEVVTAMLGLDSRWERWLAGVVVSHSRGQGTYAHPTATGGAVASSLTALHPYAGYKFNERTSIWGVLGYGVGEMSLTPERSVTALETGLMNAMAAVGGRMALSVRSGPARRFELAIRSDARLTNTAADGVGAMAGAAGQTHRVRMMLEGSGVMPLASGGVLKPRLEAGLRYDAGDAETGAGLEVGGGLGYAFGRLSLEVNARGLLAHRDTQYEEWGFSGAVAYTPSEDGRGVSLRLGSGWGATQSGVQSLWRRQDASDLVRHAEFDAAQRYQVELRYGLDGLKGRVRWTPYIGVESGGGSSQALRLGVTLTSGRRFDAGLELGRRQGGPGAGPEHAGQIRATLLW